MFLKIWERGYSLLVATVCQNQDNWWVKIQHFKLLMLNLGSKRFIYLSQPLELVDFIIRLDFSSS